MRDISVLVWQMLYGIASMMEALPLFISEFVSYRLKMRLHYSGGRPPKYYASSHAIREQAHFFTTTLSLRQVLALISTLR